MSAEPTGTFRTVPGIAGILAGDDGRIAVYRILPTRPLERGYRGLATVFLHLGCTHRIVEVRRLVLEAFRGPCPPGMEPFAVDGDPANCAAENLRWDLPDGSPLGPEGMTPRGSAHGRRRLDEVQVAEARRLYAGGGWTHQALARRYGVSRSTIQAAMAGRSWGHLPEAGVSAVSALAVPGPGRSNLDAGAAAEARRLRAEGGWTIRALAERFSVGYETMCDLIAGRIWRPAKTGATAP